MKMAQIRSVFITGASRGIGLEFVKQLTELPHPPEHVFATCRNPDSAEELQKLASRNATVHIRKLDVIDYASYPSVVTWVQDTLGSDQGLNVLINNAAIANWEQSLTSITHELMMAELEANAVAPLMLSKAFLPLIQKAAEKHGDGPAMSSSRAAIINITSRMGSIEDNTSGGVYAYRSSKAALNIITKSLCIDLKPRGILAVALHPGSVQTEMGGTNALITTAPSVEGLLRVIQSLDAESSGKFLNFKGETLPW